MQPPTQPSPEQPRFEASGEVQAALKHESLDHLRFLVDTKVAEFGDGRYGGTVDETKGLGTALEAVYTSVRDGDFSSGQTALEQAPRPRELNEEVRDTLVELHQAERGEPTSGQRLQAMNALLLCVTSEISSLTDPKKGNLHYTDPQVQARKDVEKAFIQRHSNYFDDGQPENELLQNGEPRTPHEVANDAYDLLLAYVEDKLRDPRVTAEEAEDLRTARDTLHLERKNWKQQFDAQNEAVGAVMQMMGRDNEQFSEARVRAAVRGCVGGELSRLQELVAVARDTSDPVERFNLLNDVQHERSPIQSAEAFDAWKKKRAEKAKAAEEQQSKDMADNARKTILAIQSGVDEPANRSEAAATTTSEVVSPAQPENKQTKEAEIAPIPTGWSELVHGTNSTRWRHAGETVEKPVVQAPTANVVDEPQQTTTETVAQSSEQTPNKYERFLKSAMDRVPGKVLLETIKDITQERVKDGQQVDIETLTQQLGQRLAKGDFGIESAKLEELAKRVKKNGFVGSGGGIWQAQPNSNTPEGRIAAEARNLVREITAVILANS